MNVYLDSSALAKRYIEEAGSKEVADLLARDSVTGSSVVAIAEVTSAFRRAAMGSRITDEGANLAREAFLADQPDMVWFNAVPSEMAFAASLAWVHGLRGFDAIHLAAALRWSSTIGDGSELVFATFDNRLKEAARTEGLAAWP